MRRAWSPVRTAERHPARHPEQWPDQDWQAPPQRHRRPHHAPCGLSDVADLSRDDECIFGWGQAHGTMRKAKHRGLDRVGAIFMLNLIAYNLVRLPKLIAA